MYIYKTELYAVLVGFSTQVKGEYKGDKNFFSIIASNINARSIRQ